VQGKLSKGRKELKPGVTFNKGELIFTINDTETQYALRARKSGFINIVASLLPDIKVDFPTEYTKWENYVGQIKLNEDLPQLPAWTTTKEKIFLSTRNVLSEYFSIMGAEEQLKKYKIFAPFTGIITEAFVSHQAIVNPGTKALRFVEIGNYEIPVSIPAEQIGKILLGTEADIFTTTGTLKGKGKVIRISEVLNRSTQSVDVYIKATSIEKHKFIEGEYVKVAINQKGNYNGFRLPLNAIQSNGDIFVYNKKTKQISPTKVNILDENETGVFVAGLDEESVVITQEIRNYSDTSKYEVIIK
jgi:multidrug efflux pump subunit AcrA (membrane-fusion protein)